MRHNMDRRKLGRSTAHRKAMMANLACSLIEHERIETTLPRAKEVRRVVEKSITKGKSGSLTDRRVTAAFLRQPAAVKKVFGDLANRFEKRPGGYTRILRKSSRRVGDAAEMAYIEFVDYKLPSLADKEDQKAKRKEKKEAKDLERQAAVGGATTAGVDAKASGRGDSSPKKASTQAAGGASKSTTVRKTSKG